MADRKNDCAKDVPDLIHIIRSIQRIEGNPDCFGTAEKHCDHMDCLWREYCLKEPKSGPFIK